MEIKIKEILQGSIQVNIMINNEVPLAISINKAEEGKHDIFHYEFVSDSDSFFEIEIFKKSGEIKSLLLVNFNETDLEKVDSKKNVFNTTLKGEPIIDVSSSSNDDYFDNFFRTNYFRIIIYQDCYEFLISDHEAKSYIELSKKCFFGISEFGLLTSVLINGLSKDENEKLNTMINANR